MDSYDLFGEDVVGGNMLEGLADLGTDNFDSSGAHAGSTGDAGPGPSPGILLFSL